MKNGNNKTLNLLLKSSFRNTVKSWPVAVALTLLIALLAIVISLMTSIKTRIEDNYSALNRISNNRDALIDLQPGEFVGSRGDSNRPTNVIEAQQYFIYQLEQKYANEGSDLDFYWSRTEARDFQGVFNGSNSLKIKTLAKTNPLMSTDKSGKIVGVDQLAISEGHGMQTDKQIVIDATFARTNNIHIGDIIRVQEDYLGNQLLVKSSLNFGKDYKDNIDYQRLQNMKNLDDPNDVYSLEYSTLNWLQVVGFGESADYTMPVIDNQSTMPNKKTELVSYVMPSQFGIYLDQDNPRFKGLWEYDSTRAPLQSASTGDSDAYYSLKFKDANFKASKSDIEKMNTDFIALTDKAKGTTLIYGATDKNYQYASRVTAIETTLYVYHVISGIIFAVVAVIVLFSIVLVSKKQIDKTRSQIGIMKAIGYKKRQMVWNYISLPFITSITGGIIGFVISQGVQGLIINLFNKFFNLDITGWSFDWLGFIIAIVIMWFVVCAISFGIAYYVMRADTLSLLGAARASHISRWGLKIKSLNRSTKITPIMESSLLASNSGKMLSVTLIVLVATILMTATFTLPTVLNKNKTATFNGMKYKQVVDFQTPVYNNPYTFFRTWDPTQKGWNYQYASALQKVTSLPVDSDGNYDMDAILGSLATGKLSSEYYDLEFDANADKKVEKNTQALAPSNTDKDSVAEINKIIAGKNMTQDQLASAIAKQIADEESNDSSPTGTPNALDTLTANMKMLSMYNVALSNRYFKLVSDWAIRDPFGWNILANQWPKYLEMTRDIRSISNGANKNPDKAWTNTFLQLQSFYKTFTESVGLTVSRDFYDYSNIGHEAYLNKDYKSQINLYNGTTGNIGGNNNADSKLASATSYRDERFGADSMFGDMLNKMSIDDQAAQQAFQLSDGTHKGIGINHILKGAASKYMDPKKSDIDQYLTANPDNMSTAEKQAFIQDYLQWYGCYFSQRSGTAIVQAGYTRPPYFVQQYMKKAYNAPQDVANPDVYRFTFANVPWNPDTEQLGTKLSAEVKSVKNTNVDFNIYGIQNNHTYIDLKDSKGNDLISRLFDKSNNYDKYQTAGIIINESLAKKIGLGAGDTVDMNVLYKELDKVQNGGKQALTIKDGVDNGSWKQPNIRLNNKNKDGFISFNDMDTFNTTADDVAFTSGNSNLTNAPSAFYTDYLNGEYANVDRKDNTKFKILGVHDGYGSPMAWIKNDDANKISKYDQDQTYFWNVMFRNQFAKEFMKDSYKKSGYYFKHDLRDITYENFMDNYVNGQVTDNISQDEINAAQQIDQVFNNAYPIFNYKYSMSNDIGDLQSAVSTWVEVGDYSPIAENGGIAGGLTYDGIGTGSIFDMLPTQITKQILNEMTSVIMAVVIIIIVLVIILAFIIIMLTTSLVISDNQSFISTMKVLGYSNTEIVNRILGMYAISIVCSFAIGFIVGWFSLSAALNNMAMGGGMVLPLAFPAFLVFAVIAAVCGLYIITFAIGFYKISRSNPLDALKDAYM